LLVNNAPILALLIGIAVLAILFVVIVLYMRKGQKREPDYRAFFILGIAFLPIGIATDNPGLWGMGTIFMVIGLVNRGKWGKEPEWSELSPGSRRVKLVIIGGLTVLLLATLFFYIFTRSN
jgi:hypothetical protein